MEKIKRIFPGIFMKHSLRFSNIDKLYPALSLAVLPLPDDVEERRKLESDPNIIVFDMNEAFKDYADCDHKKTKILFTHLGQGIGDIIAFSAVAAYLKDKTLKVFVEKNKFSVFNWYDNSVQLHDYNDPVATNWTPINRMQKYSHFARLRMEHVANDAGSLNWYDAMFQRIGLSKAPEGFDRPHLKQLIPLSKSSIGWKTTSILICHRSSCQMRTSRFEDFYFPAREMYPNATIYVHEADLSTEDKVFFQETTDLAVVIPKCTLQQYFANLYNADMVIATDTAALHFREGIQKPCLGVYGAFTVESRTSGYRYARTFNTKSECPHQPCFIHQKTIDHVCPFASPGDTVAKCQSGKSFQDQLLSELKEYELHGYSNTKS